MCGILGVYSKDKIINDDLQSTLINLAQLISSRGPDNQSFYNDSHFLASHNRLAINDLSTNGNQPFISLDGKIILIFNGEIYNHQLLKENYFTKDKHKTFKSYSDGEIILHLYKSHGIEKTLSLIEGMFAFVIYNKINKSVIIARDPVGIKPLFYTNCSDKIIFSSTQAPLITYLKTNSNKQLTLSKQAVNNYFGTGYSGGKDNFHPEIQPITPGTFIKISSDFKIEEKKFFDILNLKPAKPITRKESIQKLDHLLHESIKEQTISNAPWGIMLSGGIDSTTILSYANDLDSNKKIKTYSLTFDSKSFDESNKSRFLAEKFKTDHTEIKVTPELFRKHFHHYITSFDSPLSDGATFATYLLTKEAKKKVKVLLSGEGADELLGGYDTHSAYYARKYYMHIPNIIRESIKKMTQLLPISHEKINLSFKIHKFVNVACNNPVLSHYRFREIFSNAEQKKLLDTHNTYSSSDLFISAYNQAKKNLNDELNAIMAVDIKNHLLHDLLVKCDRMSMCNSLEIRVPFLNKKIVEFLYPLDSEYKIYRGERKHLLKSILKERSIPQKILKTKKIGLNIPYSSWFHNELKDFIKEQLNINIIKATPYLHHTEVNQILNQHFTKKRDNGRKIWALLHYVSWYHHFFNKGP